MPGENLADHSLSETARDRAVRDVVGLMHGAEERCPLARATTPERGGTWRRREFQKTVRLGAPYGEI